MRPDPAACHYLVTARLARAPAPDLTGCMEIIQEVLVSLRGDAVIEAMVVLPDHLHCLWRQACGREAPHGLWARALAGIASRAPGCDWVLPPVVEALPPAADLRAWLDRIHGDPVRHGLCAQAREWPWSSFYRYSAVGYYPPEWPAGAGEPWQGASSR